jgi:hypothetical protein
MKKTANQKSKTASPGFEKSLENPEASQWVLIPCDFHLWLHQNLKGGYD